MIGEEFIIPSHLPVLPNDIFVPHSQIALHECNDKLPEWGDWAV